MSGFGTPSPAPFGGFGQQQQPPQQQQQQQQQLTTAFGNPFGAPQQQQQPSSAFGTEFGAPVSSVPSSGFAAPTSSGFGAPPAPSGMTFGSSPNVAAPAPSFGPSGTASLGSGQSSSAFGTSSGFGTGSTAFGNNIASTASSASTPFGSTAPSAPPFGSSTTSGFSSSTAFGTSSILAPSGGFASGAPLGSQQPAGPFGTNASSQAGPFATTTATSAPNPFGSSSSTAPVSFGMSNNVVSANSDLDMGSASPTPYFGSPMHQQSDSEDMADSSPAPASNLPFGTPTMTTTSIWPSAPVAGTLSPIPETSGQKNESLSPPPIHSQTQDEASARSTKEEKLALLLAKLEAKKKKLEERRRKEAAAKSTTTLRPEAPPFVPPTGTSNTAASSSLAERNLLRFATKSTTPRETPSHSPVPSSNNERPVDRETLANAKTLIGTCQTMCPDEELARREREGDIQLLEIPQPGTLHPQHWTIRDTAVKRFRRSAADYKLDIPEWVRPPDVLEKVCGYLEEWVMERDRQGPDPRLPNSSTPASLDVYQFIWDRTRMIRKDFILQNYVGSGGMCDARAVRCHERIARWHAMCEHQLSHISDFVVQQSQQNIQELGQTMKTLNQYYDDSLGRCLVEVPDDAGNESRTDLKGFAHGCGVDVVQGKSPIDYDGNPLVNEAGSNAERRLIGKGAIDTPNHGTAEPEMRGLYILLTIDNDGGMEVLNYAAKLFRDRPGIYQSRPVQLALSIYKAKREYNYARFFSILRAPTTPYLFACIMFKHVEIMRKVAFRIMSKTFGGRSRETNEAIYDAYPLRDLVRLLCFEDTDEARAACQHYNITVKPVEVRPGVVEDIIFWRHSSFKEPKDPDKGTTIQLRPKKMMNTIESKLNGATRLAVCRGEVSGEGAFLEGVSRLTRASPNETPEELARRSEERAERLRLMKQKEEERREAEEKRKQEEEAERRRIEQQRRNEEAERLRVEEEKKRELEKQRLLLMQQKEKEMREAEARRKQEEEAERRRIEEQKREEEAQRKRTEEEKKRELEKQKLLLMQQKEKERQEADARRKQEKEAERRRIEERMRREEQERQRIEEQRRLEEARRRRMEELKRIEMEKEAEAKDRVDSARKTLVWLRWLQRFPKHLQMIEEAEHSLNSISPIRVPESVQQLVDLANRPPSKQIDYHLQMNLRRMVERLLKEDSQRLKLPSMLAKELAAKLRRSCPTLHLAKGRQTFLLRIALLLPECPDSRCQSLCDLVRSWLGSLLQFDSVALDRSQSFEVRQVFVDAHRYKDLEACDGALIVVPSELQEDKKTQESSLGSLVSRINDQIPRVVLALDDQFDPETIEHRNCTISSAVGGSFAEVCVVNNTELSQDCLLDTVWSACKLAATAVAASPLKAIDCVSFDHLACMCMGEAIWQEGSSFESRDDVLDQAIRTLGLLVDELDNLGQTLDAEEQWPAAEFASRDGDVIKDYFDKDRHLPVDWTLSLSRRLLEPGATSLYDKLKYPLPEALENLLAAAPYPVIQECKTLLDKRMFRRCLQRALLWRRDALELSQDVQYVYLPRGMIEQVVKRTVQKLEKKAKQQYVETDVRKEIPEHFRFHMSAVVDDDFVESIDLAPDAPVEMSSTSMKRSRMESSATPALTDEAVDSLLSRDQRRQKRSRKTEGTTRSPSREEMESAAFTNKLEALLSGSTMKEMFVGDKPLSALLRDAPELVIPSDD